MNSRVPPPWYESSISLGTLSSILCRILDSRVLYQRFHFVYASNINYRVSLLMCVYECVLVNIYD